MKITHKKKILIFILILIFSKLLMISETYDDIQQQTKYDFTSYQKVSKTFIGQNTEITKRAWQYPPLYSIVIIPTLFINTTNYLLFLDMVFSIVSFYFLFLFMSIFLSKAKASIFSLIIIFFDSSYFTIRIGMPIVLSSMLFIIFIYYLYNIKDNKTNNNNAFIYCILTFSLLVLTKYLFLALIPFIIYWLSVRYPHALNKKVIIFFSLPILFLSIWFLKNCLSYGFSVIGMLGGYSSITLNIHLIPNRLIFLVTNLEGIWVMIIYLFFILSYFMLLYYSKYIYINKYLMSLNLLLLLYFILTFFMFGFLYEGDEFRLRYFIYQIPIIMSLSFINAMVIDEKLNK